MGSSPRYGRAPGRTSSRAAVRSWVLPGSTSETHSGTPPGAASACTFPAGSCALPEYHLSISFPFLLVTVRISHQTRAWFKGPWRLGERAWSAAFLVLGGSRRGDGDVGFGVEGAELVQEAAGTAGGGGPWLVAGGGAGGGAGR